MQSGIVIVVLMLWGCSAAPSPTPAPSPTTPRSVPIDAPLPPADASAIEVGTVDAGALCPKPCMDICCQADEACAHGNGADGISPKCMRPRRR